MSRLAATNRVKLYQSNATVFEDDFIGTDGTTIDSSTPETAVNGAIWVDDGTEALVIASNKMSSVNVTGVNNCNSFVNVQNEDLIINTTVNNGDTTFFSKLDIIVRYYDATNYISATLDQTVGTMTLTISKRTGATWSALDTLVADNTYAGMDLTLEVAATSTTITLTGTFANGDSYSGSATSSLLNQATKAGIYCSGSDMTISDFKVTKL